MPPSRARTLCDEDPVCGGFTYRGFISETHHFHIYFFHLVLNFEEEREAWNWVTYKARKDYITFDGKIDPGATVSERYQGLDPAKAR